MARASAPSFQEIEDLWLLADNHWRQWRRDADLNARYFEEGVPKSEWDLQLSATSRYIVVRPPTMRAKCLSAVTRLLTNDLEIEIEKPVPVGRAQPTARTERDADYGEALLRALLYHAGRVNGNEDPVRESAIHTFVAGMGAVELWYDESDNPRPLHVRRESEKWQDWLARRAHHFPLYVTAVDPLALWPSPDDGLSWVIKRFKRTGWELAQAYPQWRPERAEGDKDWRSYEYDFFVYADKTAYKYGVWGEHQHLKSAPHFWGEVPIVIWPSGLGRGSSPQGKYRALCTDAIKGKLFIEEARILTQIDAINANRAWPARVYSNHWGKLDFSPDHDNQVDDEPANIQGGVLNVPGQVAPSQLFDELRMVGNMIDLSTISEVLGTGEAPASDPTSKYIRRLSEGGTKIQPTVMATSRAWERSFSMLARALRHPSYFGDDERFVLRGGYGREAFTVPVSRDRIPVNPMIRVIIDPEAPQEKFAKLQAGLAMRSQADPQTGMPVIDIWTLLERYAGFRKDADRIVGNLLRERALKNLLPMLDQYLLGRSSGQIPDTVGIRDFVHAQGQGEQIAEQTGTQGAVPAPGGPEEERSLLDALSGSLGNNPFPSGLRGRQGMRGV